MYTVSCGAFLMLQTENTQGQIVHEDINPDLLLNFEGDALHLEINGFGDYEFLFERFTRDFFYNSYFDGRHKDYIAVFGDLSFSDVFASIGVGSLYFAGYGFTASSYSPIVLNNGEEVSAEMNFNRKANFAVRSYLSAEELVRTAGNWYPEEFNKYMGFRFGDATGCVHYGWLRCSVLDGGNKMIIKDFAYESECDAAILAGNTTTSINNENKSGRNNVIVYYNNCNIYININSNLKPFKMQLYDMLGHSVYNKTTTEDVVNLPSDIPTGVYLVQIVSGNNRFEQKLVVTNL